MALTSKKIHGCYAPPASVLEEFQRQCEVQGINFEQFEWLNNKDPPRFRAQDSEVAVVLEATFGTVSETIRFAWTWVESVLRCGLQNVDLEQVSLRPEISFRPWTLQWRMIKLDRNLNTPVNALTNIPASPDCALLFLAAQHPTRIQKIDRRQRLGFWIPGLMAPDAPLFFTYSPHTGAAQLGRGNPNYPNRDLAIPEYVS